MNENKKNIVTIRKIMKLLSYGFNSREISEKLNLHHGTVKRIKAGLKKEYCKK